MSDGGSLSRDSEFSGLMRSIDGRVDLGPSNAVGPLPRRVEIDGLVWFLAASSTASSGVHLLSSVCPHQGGRVEDVGDCFECPNHGWRFARDSGVSLNSPARGMTSVAVDERLGRLVADLRTVGLMPVASRNERRAAHAEDLTIALHSHACLEFVHRGFSLLTDPWLVGPAFFGAWIQYPPPVIDVASLKPNAIWISHEHSDHFHEPTLQAFDRNTPVYFPDFPNRRIVNRLRTLGFVHAHAVPFGTTVRLNEGIRITCHEPGSLWNDSVVLIEIDDFRFLNLNDAGLNPRIARAVGPVDVIASSFSPGASGYPYTWTHLSDDQKHEIGERARRGHLRMLEDAADLYGASAVLPFASHFSLWHPSHERFVRALSRNSLDDVVETFAGSSTTAIDLAPGDAWTGTDASIVRGSEQRERHTTLARQIDYVREHFDAPEFAVHHPSGDAPPRPIAEQYFLRLNDTPDIAFCEDVVVSVVPTIDSRALHDRCIDFEIKNGRLSILETGETAANITIEVPAGILGAIVHDNVSWDEAHIGYWCRFTRQPDVYHAGFWRLLQSPYFARPVVPGSKSCHDLIDPNRSIAGLLEQYGPAADRVIRRYGLYCVGCQHSTADTLAHGARAHGLGDDQFGRLLRELNAMAVEAAPGPSDEG